MSSIEFYNEILKVEKTINNKTDKIKINHKNSVADNINEDVVKKLEEMRRGK